MSNKMSKRDIKKFKNKCKLWCGLHGVVMSNRGKNNEAYVSACDVCRAANGQKCIARKEMASGKPFLVMDMKTKRLYQNTSGDKINKWSRNNPFLWCVEWVNHV